MNTQSLPVVIEELRLPTILWDADFENLLIKNDPANWVILDFFNEEIFKYSKQKVNIQLNCQKKKLEDVEFLALLCF